MSKPTPKRIATLLLLSAAAAATVFYFTGCEESAIATYPTPAFEDQWDAKEMREFIRAQGGITKDEWAKQWIEVYNRGAIDQALCQIKGDPYITLQTDDHGKLTALIKTPLESYEAPQEVKESMEEKRKQEEMDAKASGKRK